MKKQLHVHIPTPCHENWNKMTPENKGRFCNSCAKTVVDFSVMTANDVLNYLSKNKGNLCGRFADDQLQRPLIETRLQPKKGWKYWLASVASLFVQMNSGVAQIAECKATLKRNEMPKKMPIEYKVNVGDNIPIPSMQMILNKMVSTWLKKVAALKWGSYFFFFYTNLFYLFNGNHLPQR